MFFGGVPVQPDVKLLLDVYGRPEVGQRFAYGEVADLLHSGHKTARFRTVTNVWRRAIFSLYNIVIGCVDGEAFMALSESQRLGLGLGKYRTGIRGVRKAHGLVAGCDSTKLTSEEKARQTHTSGVAAQLLLYERNEARRLMTAHPVVPTNATTDHTRSKCGLSYSSPKRGVPCPVCNPFPSAAELLPDPLPDHDGETYDSVLDKMPLNRQAKKVFNLMVDGQWRTLSEISDQVEAPEASVSARLRDFRKEKWGGFRVDRRLRDPDKRGLFEYRVVITAKDSYD